VPPSHSGGPHYVFAHDTRQPLKRFDTMQNGRVDAAYRDGCITQLGKGCINDLYMMIEIQFLHQILVMKTQLGHVYLVDDDPDVRFYLGDLLRQLGYSVTTYEHADHFFKEALEFSPAVVLMDMRMPGLTGVQAQRRLADIGRLTPVVFISGESQPQEIIDAMKGGAVDFLIKPFNREQLVAAVDKALRQDGAARDKFVRATQVKRLFGTLTEREREVFFLILQGHANIAIGELTGVQAGTVKKHRASIYEKFHVDTVAALIEACQGVDLQHLA
jgi:FixJ family two-component response regulator